MDENKELPVWYDGKKVNEVLFCQEFLRVHPMVCVKGSFFSVDHRITDERELKKEIYDMLCPYVLSCVARKVDGLVEALRSEAYLEDLPDKFFIRMRMRDWTDIYFPIELDK